MPKFFKIVVRENAQWIDADTRQFVYGTRKLARIALAQYAAEVPEREFKIMPCDLDGIPSLMGFKSPTISAGSNAKTVKGDSVYQTAIMYLAPYTSSGLGNLCATADIAKCHEGCLFRSGRAAIFESVNNARVGKTRRYFADRSAFMAELVRDISRFVAHCKRLDVKPAVRLNGTSDIQWEIAHPCYVKGVRFESIFAAFPDVVFYDYTKIVKRAHRALPANYSLTLSYSAANPAYAASVIDAAVATGLNVAVVYRSKALRNSLLKTPYSLSLSMARPVIDGDETDMRFLDDRGVIVGLYAKGPAKKDQSGFVVG